MEALPSVISRKKGSGTHVISAGNLYRIIADGKETDNRFSLMETMLEPGQGAPYHTHTYEDEAFFILEGEVTFYLKDEEIIANMEDFVSCPPGVARGFRNNTNKTARMLLFYSSAGVEEMTVREGEAVDNDSPAPSPKDSAPKAQCPVLAQEYGITDSDIELPDAPNQPDK